MTDRMFTDCCYGTEAQHAEWQPCSVNEMTETHPGHWNDNFNNVFVDARRGCFIVSIRAAGNRHIVISEHDRCECALAVAMKYANGPRSIFSDHGFGREAQPN